MLRTVVFLLVALAAFAQTVVIRVSPEEATKHLVRGPSPRYPEDAELGRIQGNVILEVRVDEAGAARVQSLVRGHPMLVPAAINAVNQWKYQPLEVDGRPAAILTFVMVTFGSPGNAAEDRKEMSFLSDFWNVESAAESAMSKQDYLHADEQLKEAHDIASRYGKDAEHVPPQWLMAMGRLRMAQQKSDEAEKCYTELLLYQTKVDKESPDVAFALANLAAIHAQATRFDSADQEATHALAIYEKQFKKTKDPATQRSFGQAIATESRLLMRIALERKDPAEADRQCVVLKNYQGFLSDADRATVLSSCQTTPAKK